MDFESEIVVALLHITLYTTLTANGKSYRAEVTRAWWSSIFSSEFWWGKKRVIVLWENVLWFTFWWKEKWVVVLWKNVLCSNKPTSPTTHKSQHSNNLNIDISPPSWVPMATLSNPRWWQDTRLEKSNLCNFGNDFLLSIKKILRETSLNLIHRIILFLFHV